MFIRQFSEIKQLFDLRETESGVLDYKMTHYSFSGKINQSGKMVVTPQEQKHELLKDVCSMLNDRGGTLLLGVAEDDHGAPLGQISDAGILNSAIPKKYGETLEQFILTGIEPPARVSIAEIKNDLSPEKSFISINIPQQAHPVFCVIKDKSGNEKNEIYIRRGRNIGCMTIEEIKAKVLGKDKFIDDTTRKFDELIKVFSKSNSQDLMLVLYAFPSSPNFDFDVTHSEQVEQLLRGSIGNQTKYFRVAMDTLNLFPYPTFEGMRISIPGKGLEVWEKGNVVFQTNLTRLAYTRKFIHESKDNGIISGRHEVINPYVIQGNIINFFRFIVDFYEHTQYYGDILINVALCPTDGTYVYRNVDGWGAHYQNHDFQASRDSGYKGLKVEYDAVGSYYGPRITEKDEIIISTRLTLPTFSSANLDELDSFVKEKVLNYLWRAYTFDSFPDIKIEK